MFKVFNFLKKIYVKLHTKNNQNALLHKNNYQCRNSLRSKAFFQSKNPSKIKNKKFSPQKIRHFLV